MSNEIVKAIPQLIRVTKVNGQGWMVYCNITQKDSKNNDVVFQRAYRFYTKKEATAFVFAH